MTDKTTRNEGDDLLEEFAELVGDLAQGTAVRFGRVVRGVVVGDDLARVLGVTREEPRRVMTATGPVQITAEPDDGGAEVDLTVDALRAALKAAVDEIVDHNHEYKHRTPAGELESWRKLAAGDPETETRARLVALGKLCRPPPAPSSPAVGTLDAARHVFVDLPRWEDDGGAS